MSKNSYARSGMAKAKSKQGKAKGAAKGRKSTAESTAKTPTLRVPKHGGGKLKTGGTPGNKGGTGRPPNEFKAYLTGLVSREDVRLGVESILTDPKMAYDPAKAKLYLDAFKWAAEQVHGKANQPVAHEGELGLTVTFE